MEELILNWAGLPTHPTDEYVHWSDKDAAAKMKELRKLWEDVFNPAGKDEARRRLVRLGGLKKLLDAAYTAGQQDERDSAAGEGL